MDFMDNVKKAITDTAKIAAQKTGEFVENSKTKYSIYDLKNEIEKIYTEIGAAVYTGRKEDNDISEFVEKKCDEIDVLAEKMDILKKKLNKE